MKFIKKASVVALSVLSMNMAQAYTETGKIQCNARNNFDDKETVILFVNGINNDLDQAENSRKKLSEVYSCNDNKENKNTCDFRKSYNNTEKFLHDMEELHAVGTMEFASLQQASIDVLNDLKKSIDEAIHKQYGHLNENNEITINNYKTTIKILKETTKSAFEKMIQEQKRAFDNDELLFNPKSDGTSFDLHHTLHMSALAQRGFFSSNHAMAYKYFSENIFLKQKTYLTNRFFFKYNYYLTEMYFSENNFEKFRGITNRYLTKNKKNEIIQSIEKAVEHLQNNITEFVLAGKKVVVVAHSQGNHMIELAYAKLAQEQDANFMNAIRVVGVAPVASTTPNNAYITWDQDHTVLRGYIEKSFANPLKPNFKNNNWWWGSSNDIGFDHDFRLVYLANNIIGKYTIPTNIDLINNYPEEIQANNNHKDISSLDVVRHLITGARKSAQAIPKKLITTNTLLTAQLRWEDYDNATNVRLGSGNGRDMDLHIIEPHGRQVYYNSPYGSFGELDLDDRDGDGPEHYFLQENTTCNDLSNTTWTFLIHQYPSGGYKATAHFMLKLGNNRVTSHSFTHTKWSSNTTPIATVTFAPYVEEKSKTKTLDYTIKVTDSVTNLDGGENNNN